MTRPAPQREPAAARPHNSAGSGGALASKPLRWLTWLTTAAYAVVLFTTTHLPPTRIPKTRVSDKLQHVVSYAILAALVMVSLRFTRPPRAAAAWTIAAVLALGAIDELTQPLVGRVASFQDWLADATGAAAAVALILIFTTFRRAGRG